ncbi:DinB family protein [Haloferula sp.]|uniref:DinB family protein n=1 Tax=Haloferula sp. TaxID=2497595 RepID=UPI00329B5FD8
MSTTELPQLDAPGAGMPAPMLFVARKLFSIKCRMGSREEFVVRVKEERRQIRHAIDACPQEKRGERVLIDPIRGLEDSSRYQSIWMTLQHLEIVNAAITGIMSDLTNGKQPEIEVRTENVKPDPAAGVESEKAFETSCDNLLAAVAELGELKTSLKHPHPWFGPLNAHRWLALAAMHMGIHRAQISAIHAGLTKL